MNEIFNLHLMLQCGAINILDVFQKVDFENSGDF